MHLQILMRTPSMAIDAFFSYGQFVNIILLPFSDQTCVVAKHCNREHCHLGRKQHLTVYARQKHAIENHHLVGFFYRKTWWKRFYRFAIQNNSFSGELLSTYLLYGIMNHHYWILIMQFSHLAWKGLSCIMQMVHIAHSVAQFAYIVFLVVCVSEHSMDNFEKHRTRLFHFTCPLVDEHLPPIQFAELIRIYICKEFVYFWADLGQRNIFIRETFFQQMHDCFITLLTFLRWVSIIEPHLWWKRLLFLLNFDCNWICDMFDYLRTAFLKNLSADSLFNLWWEWDKPNEKWIVVNEWLWKSMLWLCIYAYKRTHAHHLPME